MTAKPKRKFNWAIPGLLAMILIIVGIATAQTLSAASPALDKLATTCGSCHTMDAQVHSWQESSHKDVACTACHADTGALGYAEMQYHRLEMVLSERGGQTDLAKVATEVPNERCTACHARQMPWVMQDLKPAKLDTDGNPIRPARNELQFLPAQAGHDLHLTLDQPLQCTDCHTGVSHGPAVKPDKVEDWHGVCLDCHAQQKVAVAPKASIACSACHVDLEKVAPESHKDPNFAATAHGKQAINDINACTQCHLNPGISGKTALGPHALVPASLTATAATPAAMDQKLIPQFPPGSLKVPEGMKDDCASCHGITMPHPNDWLKQHTTGYQEKPELCATCHGARDGSGKLIKGDPKTLPTTDPKCTSCHAQPMPHPADYLQNSHATQAQANPAACQQCHSSQNPVNPNAKYATPQFCKDCHLSEFKHAAGYTLKHKDVLAAYSNDLNAAGCTTCHSTVQSGQNSCTSCHTGGVGQKTQWHPEDFVATHKDKLAAQNNNYSAAGCTQCHTTVKGGTNSCAACHTSGLGKKTQWHPDGWWVTHAQTTTVENKASCEKCHAYVEPSCSKCHSKF